MYEKLKGLKFIPRIIDNKKISINFLYTIDCFCSRFCHFKNNDRIVVVQASFQSRKK